MAAVAAAAAAAQAAIQDLKLVIFFENEIEEGGVTDPPTVPSVPAPEQNGAKIFRSKANRRIWIPTLQT